MFHNKATPEINFMKSKQESIIQLKMIKQRKTV